MSKKEENVVSIAEYCKGKRDSHARWMLDEMVSVPHEHHVARHLNNMRLTYGEDVLRQVIFMMGLDKGGVIKAG